MSELGSGWRALSVRQPWADLILSGAKTIEIREWENRPSLRGPFILHAARAIDWKTVELLQMEPPFARPRGAFVGVAEIVDVIEISSATNWRDLLLEHRVVHPPPNDRTVWGLRLAGVRAFHAPVKGRGQQYFFPVPAALHKRVGAQLAAVGRDPHALVTRTW